MLRQRQICLRQRYGGRGKINRMIYVNTGEIYKRSLETVVVVIKWFPKGKLNDIMSYDIL